MEFESSDGKKLLGVLVEEDAMYEAWHVRLREKVRFLAFGSAVFTDLVSVMTYDLKPPKAPIVSIHIHKIEWTCPHCGASNVDTERALSAMSLTCFNCHKLAEGVLVDSNNEILLEGQPFPE